MRRLIRLGLIASLVCSSAQGAMAADDTLQFFDSEARVVLAAARHKQRTSDAPANVYVIPKEDIERYDYRTLGEALQSVPGIFVYADHGYSYIVVNGVQGTNESFDNHVLLLINGHRTNDDNYGQSMYNQLFSVNMRSVERIEVVKGPGASLYGDNAFLAVINVVTKTAETAPAIQTSAEMGSYGTHEEFLGLAKKLKNGIDIYASGSYHFMKGQDIFNPEARPVSNGVNGIPSHADREEAYNLFALISGALAGTRWEFMSNVVERNKDVPTVGGDIVLNNNGSFVNDSYSFAQLKLEKEVFNNVTLTERTYYDWYYYHANYLLNNAPPPPTVVIKDNTKEDWWGEELLAHLAPFGEENALTLGGDFEKLNKDRQWTYQESPYSPFRDAAFAFYRWSLFGQQEVALARNLALNLGARYDRYQDFGHTINPRASLVYHPSEYGSFKLIYGTAFRAPVSYEIFLSANPPHPEKIRTYQAVYEHDFAQNGTATISYFQSRTTGLINFDGLNFSNSEDTRTDGVEVGSRFNLGWSYSGHLSYQVQRSRDVGKDRLYSSPTHLGNLGLSKRLSGINNTTLSAEVFLISSNTTLSGTKDPATALLSVIARTQPWIQGPIVFAGIHNILNTTYLLSASAGQPEITIPQDGRNFNVGLEYRFR